MSDPMEAAAKAVHLIAELERLNAERTQGEWSAVGLYRIHIAPAKQQRASDAVVDTMHRRDTPFIAAAANALPRLLALAKAGIEAQSARARALEEAARLCDEEHASATRKQFTQSWRDCAQKLAADIRVLALKEKPNE